MLLLCVFICCLPYLFSSNNIHLLLGRTIYLINGWYWFRRILQQMKILLFSVNTYETNVFFFFLNQLANGCYHHHHPFMYTIAIELKVSSISLLWQYFFSPCVSLKYHVFYFCTIVWFIFDPSVLDGPTFGVDKISHDLSSKFHTNFMRLHQSTESAISNHSHLWPILCRINTKQWPFAYRISLVLFSLELSPRSQ